jgi:hypothetical protein
VKLFTCGACGQTLYFHNVACTRCDRLLGFTPDVLAIEAFDPAGRQGGTDMWRPVGRSGEAGLYRACANYTEHAACNWMVPASDGVELCLACRLNRTIPDLSVPGTLELWRRLQSERNRLIYSVLRLGLPLQNKTDAPDTGLAFDFLASRDPDFREGGGVTIGHDHGVITLDIAEADDAVRERVRQDMAEPYRTLLGHFRHESGHFYWDRLVRGTAWITRFREYFGDERQDYQQSLARHYQHGPPEQWDAEFVSTYASCHPWEDWAETWAHYLHIVDTLETAWQFGLRLAPRVQESATLAVDASFDAYACTDFTRIVDYWLPVMAALNTLNQSMGQGDAYPFVLSPRVIEKLEFVHQIVRDSRQRTGAGRAYA